MSMSSTALHGDAVDEEYDLLSERLVGTYGMFVIVTPHTT
jgi:hypothetical protein